MTHDDVCDFTHSDINRADLNSLRLNRICSCSRKKQLRCSMVISVLTVHIMQSDKRQLPLARGVLSTLAGNVFDTLGATGL